MPYKLATNNDALPITRVAYVPLTINGYTNDIYCHVIPRALHCCHLVLGRTWCSKFAVNSVTHYPDIGLVWNNKKTWIIHASLKQFQSVRRDNLCTPIIPTIKLSKHVDIADESLDVIDNVGVVVAETCVDTNVIISTTSVVSCDMQVNFEEKEPPIVEPASPLTLEEHAIVPSVVSCDVQVAFEEREQAIVQPTSPLEEEISVPTKSEEDVIAIGADLELQHANSKFCEPTISQIGRAHV